LRHTHRENDAVTLALLFILVAIAVYATLKAEKQVRCVGKSPYANTLQHDIHREWVCEP